MLQMMYLSFKYIMNSACLLPLTFILDTSNMNMRLNAACY